MKRIVLVVSALVAVAVWAGPATSIDQGNRLVKGNLTVNGTVASPGVLSQGVVDAGLVKADVVDAGVICLGATANGCIYRAISFTTAAIDFASATIVCEDSGGTTVTGAKTTDTCTVGMPSTLSGAGTGLHHNFTCYVSAADTVKIRACAAGTSDNPGSVTFTGYVIGAVP